MHCGCRSMTVPTSSKSLFVYYHAPCWCRIWFLCNGSIMCTREPSEIHHQDGSSSISQAPEGQAQEDETGDFGSEDSSHSLKLQGGMEDMLLEISILKKEIQELNTGRCFLQKQMCEVSTEKHRLQARINEVTASLREEVDDLTTKMVRQQSVIDALSSEKSSLQLRVSELSSREVELQKRNNHLIQIGKLHRQPSRTAKKSDEPNFIEFPFAELKEATDGFSEHRKIGEGGFGEVYHGQLRYTDVAIKLLSPRSKQGVAEFKREVDVLSRMRHPNLVTLIGACTEKQHLVYEYLSNGSLDDRLFGKKTEQPLWWPDRLRVAAEVCLGLLFLHSNTLVHGDLKPANILLDAHLKAKISDFGICRLLQLTQRDAANTIYKFTDPKGTFEYIDPHFMSTGELTLKSDIYAFGIILLQLLSRQPGLGLVKKFQDAVKEDTLIQLLDQDAGNWPLKEATVVARLGLKCCEHDRRYRPDLGSEVWKVLQSFL